VCESTDDVIVAGGDGQEAKAESVDLGLFTYRTRLTDHIFTYSGLFPSS
jgi:hypothetical protein